MPDLKDLSFDDLIVITKPIPLAKQTGRKQNNGGFLAVAPSITPSGAARDE
jgi:hypothetical protein